MAKIVLRNFDELLVSDDVARKVIEDKEKTDLLDLSLPYSIQHEDGIWIGSLKDVSTVSIDEKKVPKHFLTEENKHQFHKIHGFGKYQETYEPGYGILDVKTQYLIGLGLAKFVENEYGRKNLVVLKSEKYEKYLDLWADYLNRLDAFNEIKS